MKAAKLLKILRSKRDLARLNHIFIPAKKSERDRFRKSAFGRLSAPMFAAYVALSREGRVMFLVTVMIGFAGLDVTQTQVHLLFAMLSGLIVASLAARPFFRAYGLSVHAEAPLRVSMGEVQRFVVTLSNQGARRLATLRVGAPFLPWDGQWITPPESISAVRPGTSVTTHAEARFLARGEHHIDSFEVGMLVPFGLAIGPRRVSNGPRFLVIPRIAHVAALTLRHALPSTRDPRVLSVSQGEAEFASVRPYRSGDPLKHLHARTWARTGVPHVRSYVAEKSERVGIALALDGEAGGETEKEAALSLAAGVAAHLVKSGGGLSTLMLDIDRFAIEPRSGRAALDAVLDRLAVYNLSSADAPVEGAIAEVAKSLSSIVLVTADLSPRRAALVERLGAAGIPVSWICVVPDGAEASLGAASVRLVSASAIERGEALSL